MTVINVYASVNPVLEKSIIDTKVVLKFLLPAELGIDVLGNGVGINIRAIVPESTAVGEEFDRAQVAAKVVSGDTEPKPELEIIHPAGLLHKVLTADAPACTDGREPAPLVIGTEAGRSLTAKGSGQQIFFLVVVIYTGKHGDKRM